MGDDDVAEPDRDADAAAADVAVGVLELGGSVDVGWEEAVVLAEELPAAAGPPLPPEAARTVKTMSTNRTAMPPSRMNLRRQYTDGGWDPTGENMSPSRYRPDCAAPVRRAHEPGGRACEDAPDMPGSDRRELVAPLLSWYDRSARDLPWRAPDAGPWAVLTSEIMLQQTPVARVLPVYTAWLERWPDAASLARDAPGDAVRMWGKLGYPRRALRLHECAREIAARFDGQVPADVDTLLTLPGIGAYTARAVACFAFGLRHPVVDTNVRRVTARAIGGQGDAGPPSTVRDLAAVEALLPRVPACAARFSVALMELGALVCIAGAPRCDVCPITDGCAWLAAGSPRYAGPTRRRQRFTGTDRQVRGLLLDVLRRADHPVDKSMLDLAWGEPIQRERALHSLVADGLIDPLPDKRFALPE